MSWEAGGLSEITALFADCRGFTTLMHERGPQAVRPAVDMLFRKCSEIVVRYDGIVDHFLGDAVLAFFNVPIRRQDHVARAVRAATEILENVPDINRALGEDMVKVGVGVSTGFAYAGVVGSNSCTDYTALGDAVNIASRLQGEAEVGELLVSEQVYDVVGGAFPGAQERMVNLKGIKEQVRAFSLRQPVEGARTP